MDISVSDWHDAITEKQYRHRRRIDRRNECILCITFLVWCGILQLPKLTGIPLTTADIGILFFLAIVWLSMLTAAVHQFPVE